MHIMRDVNYEDALDRARALVPLLARNAALADTSRTIPQENIDALSQAGLLSLGTPKRFGGGQSALSTQLEVAATLAHGCGSTAWVAQVINGSEIVAGMFSEQAQRDIWGENPRARVVASVGVSEDVKRVDGGWEIAGQWSWISGSLHGDWAFLGFPLVDEQGEARGLGFGLVPLSAGAVKDTWFVTGMRGTGSNTFVLEPTFVPDHRVLDGLAALEGRTATEHKDEALYRTSLGVGLVYLTIGTTLGLAEAALDFVGQKASKRGITYTTYATQSDSVGFQIQLGEAASQIHACRLLALAGAAEIDDFAARSALMSFDHRVRLRGHAGWLVRQLRRAVGDLIDAHGASSFAEASPLQRIWRDINAAARHAILTCQPGLEMHGKAILGRDEKILSML